MYLYKYAKYKSKYDNLQAQLGGYPNPLGNISLQKYTLIGLGDFSHGDQNIWDVRFKLLEYIINTTDNHVKIFTEDTIIHTDNITNDKTIVLEKEYGVYQDKYAYGPLDRYSYRAWDSEIYLAIIKYIRQNKNRIQIIGVDAEKARDKFMAKRIMENLANSHNNSINFFWAANAHVDSRIIDQAYELKWEPVEKYRCGYYLKQKLGSKYCIILSTGYSGTIRFSSICSNNDCDERILPIKPIFENFSYSLYKPYTTDHQYDIYKPSQFNQPIIEFTDAKFDTDKYMPEKVISNTWDYLIFFSMVEKLHLIKLAK